ncbi:hypothetical protein Tco_0049767, partial [Tanacetum coccineum]
MLVRQESSMDITPSVVKEPIYDLKIFKDKLREVYQIFRVGQAPKAYPYFEAMLKEFDKDDMVTLWKLVKDSSGKSSSSGNLGSGRDTLIVGTIFSSGNHITSSGNSLAFYSQQSSPKLDTSS